MSSGHARRQAKKREEILAIATDLFLKEGYGRASMDQVHARLGGSKRTLYNHFPSKEVLFEAIVSRVSDRVLAALQPSLVDTDLGDALNRMGRGYLSALLSPDGLALYRAMVSEAPHFPELAQTFFENGPGRASHHLAVFFQEQQASGNLDIDNPQIAAEQFLGAVRGDIHLAAVLSARKFPKRSSKPALPRLSSCFCGGLATRADRAFVAVWE